MKKTLFFDTETTGLDSKKNSIIQFAGIMEYDGKEVDRINIKFQPFEEAEISQEALDKTGTTLEDILGYISHVEGFQKIQLFLDKHCNKFDRNDKIYPAGYNSKFDTEFLSEMFKYNGERFGIGSYFNWRTIDPLPLLYLMDWTGKISLENYKLETVCKHFKITLTDAHDAMSDIEATRDLIKKLLKNV